MKHLHEREKNDLERILKTNGHEHSRDMVSILEVFLAMEGHQDIGDLHRRLKAQGLVFEKEKVQIALDLFCHYGFAEAKSFNGHGIRYEHRHLGQHHDHLICTRCGLVEEFVHPRIEELQLGVAEEWGFIPLNHRMDIFGLCRDCAWTRGDAVLLAEAEKGECLLICGHEGGEELERRLRDMGLRTGAEIEVLSTGSGPTVVACGGCRLALGHGMSEKIMVTPSKNLKPRLRRRSGRGRLARFAHKWRRTKQ